MITERMTRRRDAQQVMRLVRLAIRVLAQHRDAFGGDVAQRDERVTHSVSSSYPSQGLARITGLPAN